MAEDGGGQRTVPLGEQLRLYREGLRLTQTDLERLTKVKREYISSIEMGRIQVIYPEVFNLLKKVLRFPGWVLLEAMGYETDSVAGEAGGLNPALVAAVASLSDRQQRALLEFLLASTRLGDEGERAEAPTEFLAVTRKRGRYAGRRSES